MPFLVLVLKDCGINRKDLVICGFKNAVQYFTSLGGFALGFFVLLLVGALTCRTDPVSV